MEKNIMHLPETGMVDRLHMDILLENGRLVINEEEADIVRKYMRGLWRVRMLGILP